MRRYAVGNERESGEPRVCGSASRYRGVAVASLAVLSLLLSSPEPLAALALLVSCRGAVRIAKPQARRAAS